MGSQIDANQPVDGAPASKSVLRANLATAKSELEHGGFFRLAHAAAAERTTRDKLRDFALSVTDFGAVGDGATDDTPAFQAAIDAINDSGRPGTLFVPAPPGGSYRLYSLKIAAAVPIELIGERSTLKRLDNVTQIPGFTFSLGRMLRVEPPAEISPDVFGYFPLVTFRNLVFDGNRQNQVLEDGTPWQIDFGLQHHHAINVAGDDTSPARQPVRVYDCDFLNTTGEGISASRNARVETENCRFYACFRGGITVVGHYSQVIARNCYSDDPIDSENGMHSGFYMEAEDGGYNHSLSIFIDGWHFRQGFINCGTWGNTPSEILGPEERAEFILRGLHVDQANKSALIHFYNDGQSRMHVSDSIFYGGRADAEQRTAVEGRNIRFTNCSFIASNNGLPPSAPAPTHYAAVMLRDDHTYNEPYQRIVFESCHFGLDQTVSPGVPVYAIYKRRPDEDLSSLNLISSMYPAVEVFSGCDFGYLKYWPNKDINQPPAVKKFDWLLAQEHGGCMMTFHACDGFAINGFAMSAKPNGYIAHLQIDGGNYVVEQDLLDATTVEEPASEFILTFRNFIQEDRYNHLRITDGLSFAFDRMKVWGNRTIMVISDPTLAGPVEVSGRFFYDGWRSGNVYEGRLEGTPVVPGTFQITNVDESLTITDIDNGDGTGTLAGAGAGTIDYASGWFRFSWNAIPSSSADFVHTYQHQNQVPGFVNDTAVLKADPAQRWRCTATHDTSAQWEPA